MTLTISRHHAGRAARAALAVVLVLAATRCGGKEKESTGSMADYFSRMQQLDCQKALECCTTYELGERYSRPASDIEICAEIPQDVSALVNLMYQPSVDAGHIVFDSGLADACLADYDFLTCTGYAALGPGESPCASPLVPQQDPGDPCTQGFECTTGYCDDTSMTCAELPGGGEDCDLACAEGFYCDITHTCLAVLADGEECFSYSDCASGACFTPEGGSGDVCGVMCDGI